MGNEYDWKKIIRMVAVIGVLCLFVGIATRLFHKSQTSLSDYAKKNPEVALASPEKTDEEKNSVDALDAGSDSGKDKNGNSSGKAEKNDVKILSDEEKEIYDNFFFTEETTGYKFHILYYNSKHEKSTAEVISFVSDPDETLKLFYDLYKAEHEFKNITEIQDFADRFKAEPDKTEINITDTNETDTDIKNNTDEHNQD